MPRRPLWGRPHRSIGTWPHEADDPEEPRCGTWIGPAVLAAVVVLTIVGIVVTR